MHWIKNRVKKQQIFNLPSSIHKREYYIIINDFMLVLLFLLTNGSNENKKFQITKEQQKWIL